MIAERANKYYGVGVGIGGGRRQPRRLGVCACRSQPLEFSVLAVRVFSVEAARASRSRRAPSGTRVLSDKAEAGMVHVPHAGS